MGCGCKQKPATNKPIINKENNINVISNFGLNFTREELTRVSDYFIARTKTAEEKNWVIDFHNKHFPEQFPHNYSGDGWIRLKKRIEHLSRQLDEYENSKKTS